MVLFAVIAASSTDLQNELRSCPFCKARRHAPHPQPPPGALSHVAASPPSSFDRVQHVNCVEVSLFTTSPWWSCCLHTAAGTCALETADAPRFTAHCNMTGREFYRRTCDSGAQAACSYDAAIPSTATDLCRMLCSGCV